LEQKDSKQLDSDYLSFMAELDGKKPPPVCVPVPPVTGVSTATPTNGAAQLHPPPPPDGVMPPGMAPSMSLPPPPPSGMIPPPDSGVGLPPPPPPNMDPSALPPPPPVQGFQQGYNAYQAPYGQQQQQQQHYGHYQQPVAQTQYGNHRNNHQKGRYQEDETAGWDYRSYYGGTGDSGAGGFNWWEQSS